VTWSKAASVSDTKAESDLLLARSILKGDEAAFEGLVERFRIRVSRIIGRFFRRRDEIDDICQEVFIKMYSGLSGYRGEMPLEHWLSRIAVNACYDHLRRRRRRKEESLSAITENPGEFYDRLEAPEGTNEDYWQKEEARLLAERLLQQLAPADRLVITLMFLEELSVAEIAELTGWSKANVKIRAFRARSRLRKWIAQRKG